MRCSDLVMILFLPISLTGIRPKAGTLTVGAPGADRLGAGFSGGRASSRAQTSSEIRARGDARPPQSSCCAGRFGPKRIAGTTQD